MSNTLNLPKKKKLQICDDINNETPLTSSMIFCLFKKLYYINSPKFCVGGLKRNIKHWITYEVRVSLKNNFICVFNELHWKS